MPCETCIKPEAQRVRLVDGREVCTWCPDWMRECEARHVANMPSIEARRSYLFGRMNSYGKTTGGKQQKLPPDEFKAFADLVRVFYEKRS